MPVPSAFYLVKATVTFWSQIIKRKSLLIAVLSILLVLDQGFRIVLNAKQQFDAKLRGVASFSVTQWFSRPAGILRGNSDILDIDPRRAI